MQSVKSQGWSRTVGVLVCSALILALPGCATPPPPAPIAAQTLLQDALFPAANPAPDVAGLFAMSDAMRAYAQKELPALGRHQDPRRALIEALYDRGQLRLMYDSGHTRTAAEAFEARAGNCLSLVIMTASFAQELGLPVSFQAVLTEDLYSRSGGLYLASGHVNLVLGPPRTRSVSERSEPDSLTIDFVPGQDMRWQQTRPLQQSTIVAMYLNNRAAELLAQGHSAQAYWYVREALLHEPSYFNAANTLGVIYNWAGQAAAAEQAFRRALDGEPNNVSALSNLVRLLNGQGRQDDAAPLSARLERLQPVPPFQHFNAGRVAMDAGEFASARDHFERELRLQPYQPEVHYWAAQAYWRLGQTRRAERHLKLADENSSSRSEQERYSAKLDWLRNHQTQ